MTKRRRFVLDVDYTDEAEPLNVRDTERILQAIVAGHDDVVGVTVHRVDGEAIFAPPEPKPHGRPAGSRSAP